MKVKQGKWSVSSRDLFRGSQCSHCTQLSMAVAAGVTQVVEKVKPYKQDLSIKLPVIQGLQREENVFEEIKASVGSENFQLLDDFSTQSAIKAMNLGVPVIAQAFLERDLDFHWSGVADLLVRDDFDLVQGADLRIRAVKTSRHETKLYRPFDVKNASKVSENYIVQLGSYVAALTELSLQSPMGAGIIAGFGKGITCVTVDESLERFEGALTKTLAILTKVVPQETDESILVSWACSSPGLCKKIYCEYPDLCEEIYEASGDIGLLGQRSHHHINWLREAGFTKVEMLAALSDELAIPRMNPDLARFYQIGAKVMHLETQGKRAIGALIQGTADLPLPDESDLFFDIEWFSPVDSLDPIIFMFGVMDRSQQFFCFDTIDGKLEKENFVDFVEFALTKMEQNPKAHIYHVNNPEVTKLKDLVHKFDGLLMVEVETLISRMIDIQDIAKDTFVAGSGSYSIKQLEKYYPDREKLRVSKKVSAGDDAMYQFHLIQESLKINDVEAANNIFTAIRDYNRDDCLSTMLLLDWLSEMSFDFRGQIVTLID